MTMDAVVTGASTGIGRGAVRVLIGHGWRVFGSVRKPADADSLRQEFGDKAVPLLFDVTDAAAVRAAAGEVRAQLGGRTLKGLVRTTPEWGPAVRCYTSPSRKSGGCSRSMFSAR